ncbi:hypothetical protein [Sphingomonas trueperi]|uniref:hypothetical protein n=1 Tax=Sphingomonas trueperi TaxID=53317 RepID=UPI000EAF2954
MTISTSSFASVLLLASAPMALLLAGGGDRAGSAPAAPARDAPQTQMQAAAETHPAARQSTNAATRYNSDLDKAVAGAKKMPFPTGVAGIGGMDCSPATLRGTDPASRAFTLTLPADASARRHVIAVVTPERGLLGIYAPYDADAVEAGDLLIPSQAISWAKARTQNRFAVDTDDLDGLRPGATKPEALFLEPGRYRFALINGMDAALLKANGTSVKVIAACSVDWAPREAGSAGTSP